MVTVTRLPHGVKSLSELIEIENTTQTTLYVALRDYWIDFDGAECMIRSALRQSPFSFTNISSHCESQRSTNFFLTLNICDRDLEIQHIWTGSKISVTNILFCVVR